MPDQDQKQPSKLPKRKSFLLLGAGGGCVAWIALALCGVLEDLRLDVLPATIATDGNGRVIRTMWDVPSISEVRELLADS